MLSTYCPKAGGGAQCEPAVVRRGEPTVSLLWPDEEAYSSSGA